MDHQIRLDHLCLAPLQAPQVKPVKIVVQNIPEHRAGGVEEKFVRLEVLILTEDSDITVAATGQGKPNQCGERGLTTLGPSQSSSCVLITYMAGWNLTRTSKYQDEVKKTQKKTRVYKQDSTFFDEER